MRGFDSHPRLHKIPNKNAAFEGYSVGCARVADQGERTAEEVWCPSAILAVLNTSPDESVGSSSYLAFVRICSII